MNWEKKNMNIRLHAALSHVKADEALINNTEAYLRDRFVKNQDSKFTEFPKFRLVSIKNLAKAACIVFLLGLGSTRTFVYYKTPVSYLSLDINPSIELGVNAFNQVITAEGYNADGKTVLRGLNVTGANVSTAVKTVISSASDNGFIDNDGSTVISLTSVTDDAKKGNKLEIQAETGANEALKEISVKAVIYKDNVALAFRNEARELDIAPGKLNLIEELQEVNPVITVDQYRDAKVKDIMTAIGTHTDDIVLNNKEVAASSKIQVIENNKNETVNNIKESITISNSSVLKDRNKEDVYTIVKGTVNSKKEVTIDNKRSVLNDKNKAAVNKKNKDDLKVKLKDIVNSKNEIIINNKNNKNKNVPAKVK